MEKLSCMANITKYYEYVLSLVFFVLIEDVLKFQMYLNTVQIKVWLSYIV